MKTTKSTKKDVYDVLGNTEELDTDLSFGLDSLDLSSGGLDLTSEGEQPEEKIDIEKESKQEIGESLKKIRENEKKWREELEIATSPNFYFQVVFRSPEDLQKFLKKHSLELREGDYIFEEDLENIIKK